MSNNKFVLNHLYEQRQKLVDEKQKSIEKFNADITELERAIKILSGNKFIDPKVTLKYDDEHPDYIKSSQEEI